MTRRSGSSTGEGNRWPPPPEILIYGYGNPGRQDDGLGNAFVEEMERWIREEQLTGVELDSNYQLNIEDADAISGKDLVIFVDASDEPIDDFRITRVNPSDASAGFTMHAVSPSFVLDLCRKIFGKTPVTFLVHIRGYGWDFSEGLTQPARENLAKALDFVKEKLKHPRGIMETKQELIR